MAPHLPRGATRALAIGLLLAGCASSRIVPPPTPPIPPPTPPGSSDTEAPGIDVTTLDPCSLLDSDTLAELIGQEVAQGAPLSTIAAGAAGCRYQVGSTTSVTVIVMREPARGVTGEAVLESLPPDSGAEELHGVGDVSWFGYCPICPSEASTTLTVIAAPLEFSLAFEDPSPSLVARIQAEALARRIIEEFGL